VGGQSGDREFIALKAGRRIWAPGGGADKDEVQLRFDILFNRLDIFRRGDVKSSPTPNPNWGRPSTRLVDC
jgi:hypothetical protein